MSSMQNPLRTTLRILVLAVLVVVLCLTPLTGSAQGITGPLSSHMPLLHQLGGHSYAVMVDPAGQYIYYNIGPWLMVGTLTNGQLTQSWKTLMLPGVPREIFLNGDRAYIAAEDYGLIVLDITNKNNIRQIGTYRTDGKADALDVVGSLVYMADNGGGLYILDISDLANIQKVNRVTAGYSSFKDVVVVGNYAYVSAYSQGLRIFNVTDPANVVETLQYFPWPQGASDNNLSVFISGTTAYLGCMKSIRVVNMANPASPQQVAEITTPTWSDRVQVRDGKLYATNGPYAVMADVSDPLHPGTAQTFLHANYAQVNSVWASSNHLYSAARDGLFIIDLSSPDNPVLPPIQPSDVIHAVRSGIYLYVIDSRGLYVYDADNPNTLLGSYEVKPLMRVAAGLVNRKNYVFIMDQSGNFRVLDGSDPANLALVSIFSTPSSCGYPADMTLSGTSLFVITNAAGSCLISFDVSDVSSVQLNQVLDLPKQSDGVTNVRALNVRLHSWNMLMGIPPRLVKRTNAYISMGYDGLAIYNVNDPAAMQLYTQVKTGGYTSAAAVAGSAIFGAPQAIYLADNGDVHILDAANPNNPYISVTTPAYAEDVLVSGSTLFVGDGGQDVRAYNLTDPFAPDLVGYAILPGYNLRVLPSQGFEMYAVQENTGLYHFRLMQYDEFIPVLSR